MLHYENSGRASLSKQAKERLMQLQGMPLGPAGLERCREIRRMLMENPRFVDKAYRDRQVFVNAANAVLVGAALIASVTFGGFLQPPLGLVPFNAKQYSTGTQESFAAVEQHVSVRVFWAFNSLSFYSAIATVVAGGGAVLPASGKSIEEEVRMVRKWLSGTSALLAVSIYCVLGAFTAAGFASLPNDFKYERNITGLTLCVTVLALFSHRLVLSLNPLSPIRIVIRATFRWMYAFIQLVILVPCIVMILLLLKLPDFILNCIVLNEFAEIGFRYTCTLEDPFDDFFDFVRGRLGWVQAYEIYLWLTGTTIYVS